MRKLTILTGAAVLVLGFAGVAQAAVETTLAELCDQVDVLVDTLVKGEDEVIEKDCTIFVEDNVKLEIIESKIEISGGTFSLSITGDPEAELVLEKSEFDISGDFNINFQDDIDIKDNSLIWIGGTLDIVSRGDTKFEKNHINVDDLFVNIHNPGGDIDFHENTGVVNLQFIFRQFTPGDIKVTKNLIELPSGSIKFRVVPGRKGDIYVEQNEFPGVVSGGSV